MLVAAALVPLWVSWQRALVGAADHTLAGLQGRVAAERFERDCRLATTLGCGDLGGASIVLATPSQVVIVSRPAGAQTATELVEWEVSGGSLMRRRGPWPGFLPSTFSHSLVHGQQDHARRPHAGHGVRVLDGRCEGAGPGAVAERDRRRSPPRFRARPERSEWGGGRSARAGGDRPMIRRDSGSPRATRRPHGSAGSVMILVLIIALGLTVLCAGLATVLTAASGALADEAGGRAALDRSDTALAALCAQEAADWGPRRLSLDDDASATVVVVPTTVTTLSDGAARWMTEDLLAATVDVPNGAGARRTTVWLESGRDGFESARGDADRGSDRGIAGPFRSCALEQRPRGAPCAGGRRRGTGNRPTPRRVADRIDRLRLAPGRRDAPALRLRRWGGRGPGQPRARRADAVRPCAQNWTWRTPLATPG